ncbi:MAG: 50S ribosomal protein L21 [bacterium]
MQYAVIKTGGKQYVVQAGDTITVEKLAIEPGNVVSFDTLATFNDDGSSVDIGKPSLGDLVAGKILSHFRDKKVTIIKFKNKIRYRRKQGHRQPLTKVQIEKIGK